MIHCKNFYIKYKLKEINNIFNLIYLFVKKKLQMRDSHPELKRYTSKLMDYPKLKVQELTIR